LLGSDRCCARLIGTAATDPAGAAAKRNDRRVRPWRTQCFPGGGGGGTGRAETASTVLRPPPGFVTRSRPDAQAPGRGRCGRSSPGIPSGLGRRRTGTNPPLFNTAAEEGVRTGRACGPRARPAPPSVSWASCRQRRYGFGVGRRHRLQGVAGDGRWGLRGRTSLPCPAPPFITVTS
jgi:hypothetical protein